MRLQSTANALAGGEKYNIDQNAMADIKVVLKDQQHGIQVTADIMLEKKCASIIPTTFFAGPGRTGEGGPAGHRHDGGGPGGAGAEGVKRTQ